MDTNFDDLVTIHTELTTLGVYLDDAFEEQFIITQSESQELLDGIASARTSS
jgi:hypothetical protein